MIRVGLTALVLLVACSSDGTHGSPAMSSSGGSGGGTAAAGSSGSGTGGAAAGSGGAHGVGMVDAGAGGGAGGMRGSDAGSGGGSGNAAGKDAGTRQDAGVAADAAIKNPPTCPATYAELTAVVSGCSTNLACAYPEGFCACYGACSGIPPDPKVPPPIASWQCAKPGPGCPLGIPEPEAACEDEGAACSYGSCCVQRATCKDGAWTVGPPLCPP